MMRRITCFFVVGLLVSSATFASEVSNTTKLLVYAERPLDASDLLALGGEMIRKYQSYTLYRVPTAALPALHAAAKAKNALIEEVDSWNRLVFEHSTIDTRQRPDRAAVFANSVGGQHAAARARLFVVQFVGPMTAEDQQLITDAGLVNVGYIPNNAILLEGSASAIDRIADAPAVQWVSTFERQHKRLVSGAPHRSLEYVVQFVNTPESASHLDDFRAAHAVLSSASYGKYTNYRLRLSPAEANALLDDPLVVTVELARIDHVSGEREAIADAAPLNPPFWFWPYQSGYTGTWVPYKLSPDYSYYSMINNYVYDATAYRVAVADTGIRRNDPCNGGGVMHPDLQGVNITFGPDYVAQNSNCGQDTSGHGTFVAGMVAARPGAGSDHTDNGGSGSFYWAMGVVPVGSLYIQRITGGTGIAPSTITTWATDAVNAGCIIQTHSHNEYKDANNNLVPGGDYNLTAQQYDYAVRDIHLPITVSAGNICDLGNCYTMVLSPATAKNVITVGASEGYRPSTSCTAGGTVPVNGQLADSLNNVAYFSRRGTTDSRIKPDILAPGSMVSSTHAQGLAPQYFDNSYPRPLFCQNVGPYWNYPTNPDQLYDIGSGTSFSSPQVAAAAPLLTARLSMRQQVHLSPALLKAILVGSAKSVRGGTDRYTSTYVGARPNATQGFGRLFLNDVLAGVYSTWAGLDESQTGPLGSANDVRTGTFTIIDPNKPTVVVLAWTDEPSVVTNGPTLVRDLNLTVTTGQCSPSPSMLRWSGNYMDSNENSIQQDGCNGSSFYADHANNVEMVVIPAGTAPGYSQMVITWKVDSSTWWESREDQSRRNGTQPFAIFAYNVY